MIPFIEFLVDVQDKPDKFLLNKDFYKFMITHENEEVGFVIYNILTKKKRVVRLKLSREWPNADSLLGFKVRYESFKLAEQNLFRVVKVLNPEHKSRIRENAFFLIAAQEFTFEDLNDFREKILHHKTCRLIFFDSEAMKVVELAMDFQKKKGLGLELGLGYLHDLPFIYHKHIKEKEKEEEDALRPEVEMQSLSKS